MNILLNELRGVRRHGLAIIDCLLDRLERQAYRNALGHDFDRRHDVQIFGAQTLSEVEAEEEVHEPAVDDLANSYHQTLLNFLAAPQYSASKASAQAVETPAAANPGEPLKHPPAAGSGKSTSELLYTAAKVITFAWFAGGEEDRWLEELPNLVHDLYERASAFKAIEDTP